MATVFCEVPEDIEYLGFDPFGQAYRENPTAYQPMLIENSPAFVMMDGVPSAVVASYADVTTVMRNFKSFSSEKPKGLPGMQRIDFFNSLPVMNYSDPPEHTRRRKVVNPAFTPKRTELLNEAAAMHMDALIEKALAKGEFDAVSDITMPLVTEMLLGNFLGIATEDYPIFMNFVRTFALLDKLGPNDPKPQPYQDAWAAGTDWCRRQQDLARRGECDSLIGLIADSAEGGAISDDEMMAMMVVLLTGGVTTVSGVAATAMLNLARYPETADRIRADPSLSAAYLEETLRLDPLVSLVMRFAAADMVINGKPIPKGMPVYSMIAVACHDPAVFPDPYRFDIDRPNVKDHVAFGYGMHTCIGNAITRNTVPMLIRKVAERMPRLRTADRDDYLEWEIANPRSRHPKRILLRAR